ARARSAAATTRGSDFWMMSGISCDCMAKRKKEASLFDTDVDTTGPSGPSDEGVALHEAAQTRYLNYALSVITSRALPDVRDGLKPVQRRILFTMWQQNL